MQKINYGLIISDFDGTLVSEDGTICPKNKQAIAKYRENGGQFAISTGRLPNGILPRANELGLKGVVSCCQGAVIVDIETKEVIFQDFIKHETALKICKAIEKLDIHMHMYCVWEFYCNKDDDALVYYQNITGTKAKLVVDRPISQLLQEKKLDVCKFIMMVPPEDAEEIIQTLEQENFEDCVVTKSAPYLVEVVNGRCSKGTAVKFLSQYYQVPIEKTVSIGDQWNDIPMVKAAGLGIAVQNADLRLKEEADEVCPYTNKEGAVGAVIEKYGFTE